jgi:hypothetical protein
VPVGDPAPDDGLTDAVKVTLPLKVWGLTLADRVVVVAIDGPDGG